jgi:PE-PPE domain
VLVENPDRPNGGILERFVGLHIPILNVTFNGPTPNTGAKTVDISRQYDGWSDFPTYPLNLLADANAIAGILYLHGNTQNLTDPAVLEALKAGGNPMYYQEDPATNTTYYVIPTPELPLLMPFTGIVPKPVLDALDPPLRALIEMGYDRSNYGTPAPAKLFPTSHPAAASTSVAPAVTPSVSGKSVAAPDTSATPAAPKHPDVKAPTRIKPIEKALKALAPTKSALKRLTGPKKPTTAAAHDTGAATD